MIVTPDRLHARGTAVVSGARPLHVHGGIVGEPAEVAIVGRGGHEDHARWLGSPSPSPDRVTPACPHVARCGGCPWLHLAPPAARDARRALVADALGPFGHLVEPVVPCPDGDTSVRHQVKLVLTHHGCVGAYEPHGHGVIDVSDCGALAPVLRPFTHLRLPRGVRHLLVRASRTTGRTLATVIAWEPVHVDVPADGVHLHVNARPGDALLDPAGPTRHLRGDAVLVEEIDGVSLEVGPTDFFQTNPATAARLWADLPEPEGDLLDLFCGVGALALVKGRRARRVWGIEESPGAVARARRNAARNGRVATFVAGAVATAEPPWTGGTVFVNPPRKGLGDALPRVLSLRPEALVYVSCGPASLGRDLVALGRGGLHVERIVPYDMFPGTPHVETVAWLTSGGASPDARGA